MLVAFLIWELSSAFSSQLSLSMEGNMLADTQLPPKLRSPTIPGNLPAWVWSIMETQNALLPFHRPDMKVSNPLEWEGLGWIERLDERAPKLGHLIWSLTRIWLNGLFLQSWRLLPLLSPAEIAGMQREDKLEAVWEFVGQDSAGQRGVSGTASSAPVSGHLWNEFTHDRGTAYSSSCDKETPTCFKEAAAVSFASEQRKAMPAASQTGQPVWALLLLSRGKPIPNVHSV